jgi:hypothetical protein
MLTLPEYPVRKISSIMKIFPNWPLKNSRIDALTSSVSYSSEKIKNLIGYQPIISLDDGIRDLVTCYKSQAS